MFAGILPSPTGNSTIDASQQTQLLHALDPYRQADVHAVWHTEYALLVATHTRNIPESTTQRPILVCPDSGRVLAAWVRLDNRDDLISKLNRATRSSTDHELLLWAFERWDTRCVDHLIGAFSFVVYDPKTHRCYLARDQMGFRPLYYSLAGGVLSVATSAAAFHQLDHLRLEPSQEWMAQYLLNISKSHTRLPWPQIHKLAPAHTLTLDPSSPTAVPQQYFAFTNDQAKATSRSNAWVDEYRSILDEAVRCRLRTEYRLGCETSGGVDSSTCLALAAKLWPGELDEVHSFGFLIAEDEAEMIPLTGQSSGVDNEHLVDQNTDPAAALGEADLFETQVTRTIEVLGYPQEISNGSGHDPFYRICQANEVRTLLSGFGGDEGVTNAAPQLYNELIADRHLLTLVRSMHGPALLRPLRAIRTMRSSRQLMQNQHMRRVAQERWSKYSVHPHIAERFELARRHEHHHRHLEGYSSINDWILGERLANPAVATRLENCVLMAHTRNVEYRWPLLDIRLIQQFLSTPAIEKRGAGFGRYLHRRAIDDLVPAEVAWRPSKDMGAPFVSRDRPLLPIDGLLTDLHPRLSDLVDVDQMRRSRSSAATDQNPTQARFVAHREHRALQSLDVFLKVHHPA